MKKILKKLANNIEEIEKAWHEYVMEIRREEMPAQVFDGHTGPSVSIDGATIE